MPKDESRTKTLRFLLLRMAKGLIAQDQASYEASLRTLNILDVPEGWKFSVNVNQIERVVLVPKDSFSLYQTRQTHESDTDPGVKNQIAALNVLFEMFEDFDLKHHQYKPVVKFNIRDFFARYFGLFNLLYLFALGTLALIFHAPEIISFSLFTQLFGMVFLIKNRVQLVLFSILFSCFPFLLFLGGMMFNERAVVISTGLLLSCYFLEKYLKVPLASTCAVTSVLALVLILHFVTSKTSDLSPLIICLSVLGLNIAVHKRFWITVRLFGLTILLFTTAILLYFGLLNSLWVLPIFLFSLLQGLFVTIIGNEKPVTRVLAGYPVFGSLL